MFQSWSDLMMDGGMGGDESRRDSVYDTIDGNGNGKVNTDSHKLFQIT